MMMKSCLRNSSLPSKTPARKKTKRRKSSILVLIVILLLFILFLENSNSATYLDQDELTFEELLE